MFHNINTSNEVDGKKSIDARKMIKLNLHNVSNAYFWLRNDGGSIFVFGCFKTPRHFNSHLIRDSVYESTSLSKCPIKQRFVSPNSNNRYIYERELNERNEMKSIQLVQANVSHSRCSNTQQIYQSAVNTIK